jgi:hypothetical protein
MSLKRRLKRTYKNNSMNSKRTQKTQEKQLNELKEDFNKLQNESKEVIFLKT